MRRISALLFGLALGVGILAVVVQPVLAQQNDLVGPGSDVGMVKKLLRTGTARSDFATAANDTVFYGYKTSSTDPYRVYCGVGAKNSPKWDWDSGIAGTDSTQGWWFGMGGFERDTGPYPTPESRPFWYFDHGNLINLGNHNLWKARALAGRSFRRTGLAGVWHADNMATVPLSPGNISGSRSAWCGIRYSGDVNAPIDPLTANPYTNDYQTNDPRGGAAVRSSYPGYANQWNQLLYHDYTYTGSAISVSFRIRTSLATGIPGDANGTAWFTPDPTATGNLVLNPADSVMVWVGKPKETSVYDTNRRHLSEVIDFSSAVQPQKIWADGNRGIPVDRAARTDTLINTTIPSAAWGSTVRLVFQVHTNRTVSDLATSAGGFNSLDGAVVLDDVNVGGNISTFETDASIQPRVLLSSAGVETVNNPATTWITTGRPPATYGHIHNSTDLPNDDPCGGLRCNLRGNILSMQNHDDANHLFYNESWNFAFSPTLVINNSARAALQGTPTDLRTQTSKLEVNFDYYSGFDDPAVAGTFFAVGERFMGGGVASLLQVEAPLVPSWSPISMAPAIWNWGAPTCVVNTLEGYLDGTMPTSNVDSLQVVLENWTRCARFGATSCGETRGSYWDNFQYGFIRGGTVAPAITTFQWFLLNDTFPFNEDISPGDVNFDTTTALIQPALNNGQPSGGQGVALGDTMVWTSSFSGDDARMDLVFRIWPGPGNYSGRLSAPNAWALRHNRILKVPSAGDVAGNYAEAGDGSFWGAYMADNGLVGSTPKGHGQYYWDAQTWNSARMDSCEVQDVFPIQSRSIGYPQVDTWMATYHEADPKFGTLGIARDLCFLVDPTGANNSTNLCCSATECANKFSATWPPAGYPGAQTTQLEGTKIIPDGLLTPGTHVQYFVRRSAASNPPAKLNMVPDTTIVTYQGSLSDFDMGRWQHINVLPDMWKDVRFGGTGLACMLYVDAADRRGYEYAVVGALDSLGYGADNGASRGWKMVTLPDGVTTNFGNEDDPIGFVPENLGQQGLAFDEFDIKASESQEGGRLGCRIVGGGVGADFTQYQCKQGPTPAMMDYYYSTLLYDAGDMDDSNSAFHDCSGISQQQSCDASIINQWLAAATGGNEKAFWASGDGVAEDLFISGQPSTDLLSLTMGLSFVDDNYFFWSGNPAFGAVLQPLATTGDKFHSARRYGFANSCLSLLDVVDVNGQPGAELAARYEQSSDRNYPGVGAGPYGAAIYRRLSVGEGRYYATLLTGMAVDKFRSWNGANDPTTQNVPLSFNNHAAQAWMDDALNAFGLCGRRSPVISVGDQPGVSALNFVRGAFPNPSVAGAATVQFSLAAPTKVTLRFYNVAGRLVHETSVDGVAGLNSYRWNGVTSTGMKAASGVYFYRLSAPGVDFQNNSQRMVLLGQAN